MKYAGKQNARHVVILGEDEVQRGEASVKHMDEGTQERVPLDQIISHLRRAEV